MDINTVSSVAEKTHIQINSIGDAAQFAVIGFFTVFIVLAIVIAAITLLMKLEHLFHPKVSEAEVDSDEIDDETLVVISAAVFAAVGNANIGRVRKLGKIRKSPAWANTGRMVHQSSHITKK